MKFSIEIGKSGTPANPPIRGSAIKSSVVMPTHASVIRDINRRMFRMYDAAMTNNLNSDLGTSITSANSEILVSLTATRSRARKLERDNPYAWSIVNLAQNNVGGDEPFPLEMKVGKYDAKGKFIKETDTNRKIQAWWKKAGLPENCSVRRDLSRNELYWQAISAVMRDGGILFKHARFFPNNKFGYAIEPIEIDRLDHYWNRPAKGTANEIQFSIELDSFQGPIAFWILSRHPGDVIVFQDYKKYRVRVPAEDMIALWDIRTRAGQFVGMPRFSSIIQRLHRIDQFDIAHVTAAIWASCKPFFLVRDQPTATEYTGDEETASGEKISVSEPATGEILDDGLKPVLVDPKFPIEAAEAFKKENLRGVAAGSGSPYHMIGNDLEGVNFSSGRLGENAYHDECKKLQKHIIMNMVRPHFNEALRFALLSKALDLPVARYEEFVDAAVFHGRRWPYVNPLQDVQADILATEAGFTSRDYVIQTSERGGDVEEVDAEIAEGRDTDEAHGLDFTGTDPTKPGLANGEPGSEVPNPEDGPPGTPKAKKPGGKQTISKARATMLSLARNGDH